jgi:mannose-1-phosphate guanylyltransferase
MPTLVNVVLSGSAPYTASTDHFVPAYSGKSLFQLCAERNAVFADRQIIIGHNDFHLLAKGSLKALGNRNCLSIIEEDQLTNLYSVAFAAFSAGSEEIILATPSFYMISNGPGYKGAIEKLIALAGEDMIGVLTFKAEYGVDLMPFLEVSDDKVVAVEVPEDSKHSRTLARSQKHVAHSGIICAKASVYLKELKALAPEIFKAAQTIWKSRVGQYVAAESRVKVPLSTIEETLLVSSLKVKVVVQATSRLQVAINGNGGKIENTKPYPNSGSVNDSPAMLNMAL